MRGGRDLEGWWKTNIIVKVASSATIQYGVVKFNCILMELMVQQRFSALVPKFLKMSFLPSVRESCGQVGLNLGGKIIQIIRIIWSFKLFSYIYDYQLYKI